MMNTTANMIRLRERRAPRRREDGVVLFIALIALVALTLAGLSLMRSVDTGNVIAGNMAFRQAALQNTDVGVEAAFQALPNLVATTKDANVANQYYALRFDRTGSTTPLSSSGVPSVTWASVPCRNNMNAVVTCSA